jgi:hypothetical protein
MNKKMVGNLLTFLSCFLLLVSGVKASSFGFSGRDGRHGYEGQDGRNGDDRVIRLADPAPINLSLAGTDARDGGDGDDGEDASSCYSFSNPHNDLWGAAGGDGGNAGAGGDGGRGGDVTFFLTSLHDLQQVMIYAPGGRSGRSGRSGDGGRGCACSQFSWTHRECQTETNPSIPGGVEERCTNQTYYCHSGRDGSRGRSTSSGSEGRLGKVTVIPQLDPLPNIRPSAQGSLDEGLKGLTLSDHLWSIRSGMRGLLASDSQVDDNYRFYEKTVYKNFSILWDNRRDRQLFPGLTYSASMSAPNVYATLQADKKVWMETQLTGDDQQAQLKVQKIAYAEEAWGIKIVDVIGSGKNAVIILEDEKQLSDIFSTRIFLEYKRKFFLFYQEGFEGYVPAEAVTQDGHRFTIHLGKLPIPSKYLLGGKKIKVEVKVTRSLGENKVTYERERYFVMRSQR